MFTPRPAKNPVRRASSPGRSGRRTSRRPEGSVTPVSLDLTAHGFLEALSGLLEGVAP